MLSGPNAFKMLLQSMSPGCLDVSIYSSSTVVVVVVVVVVEVVVLAVEVVALEVEMAKSVAVECR